MLFLAGKGRGRRGRGGGGANNMQIYDDGWMRPTQRRGLIGFWDCCVPGGFRENSNPGSTGGGLEFVAHVGPHFLCLRRHTTDKESVRRKRAVCVTQSTHDSFLFIQLRKKKKLYYSQGATISQQGDIYLLFTQEVEHNCVQYAQVLHTHTLWCGIVVVFPVGVVWNSKNFKFFWQREPQRVLHIWSSVAAA